MIFRTIFFLSAGLLFFLSSCSTEHSQIVLAKYGDNNITMNEFEKAYAKNVGGFEKAKSDSLSKLKNFMDLYLNFKMKLRDAEVRNYNNDPVLLAELDDYKEKVGITYLLEKKLVRPSIEELYERRKWEYRVSHIMIRAAGKDEETKQKASDLLDSIKTGESFEDIAKKYSEDQFSAPGGGDLFYITAGVLPIEFEDAVYKTEPGDVHPEVVKTNYGYHIIKVTDKHKRIPAIKASHILIDFKNEGGEIDTIKAKATIDSLLTLARNGEDFSELASQYSEDPGSREKGGDLGFFQRRQMVKEFDEAAFNLDTNKVSDVIKTNFGYHIIKLAEKQAYPSFEEERENLKKMFEKQSYKVKRDKMVDSLKAKYNYQVNQETLNYILSSSDSAMLDGEHPALEEFKDMPVFTYADKTVPAIEFFEKVIDKKDYYKKLVNENILEGAVKTVSEDYILKEEALNLEKSDSEFAALMEDYRNGIFIFKLQEEEVWNKINVDSTRLYEYYLGTKENYKLPERVSFAEIYSVKDSLINYYYNQLQAGADFDSLAGNKTEKSAMKDKGGVYPLDDVKKSALYEEANKLEKPGDYSKPFKNGNGYSIVKLIEKDEARTKTFEEARAEVAGAFQDKESKRLENEYIERLNKRYEPVVYYSELEQAFVEKE